MYDVITPENDSVYFFSSVCDNFVISYNFFDFDFVLQCMFQTQFSYFHHFHMLCSHLIIHVKYFMQNLTFIETQVL